MSSENDSKYLVYRIGNETYASPLLSIREVLEFQKPKFMPNMVQEFAGVINVRGVIVGVADMRKKFSVPTDTSRRTSMLLCDTTRGPIAAIVDSVDFVLEFSDVNIDRDPPIKMKMGSDYVLGVAKNKDQLIVIIDLHKSLTEEEFKLVAA